MARYKLCLICSSKFHKPIINKEFTSLREIDEITEQFKNEEEFRNSPEIKQVINSIKRAHDYYFNKIEDPVKKNGKIGIVDMSKQDSPYISPLYIQNNSLQSPKKLIKLITSTLEEENSGKYIANFINKFNDKFNTEYTRVSGIYKYKKQLEYVNEPKSKSDIYAFKTLLEIIKLTLKHGLDKEKDEIDEEKYFELRRIYDFIKDKTLVKNLSIKKIIKNKKMKTNKEESKKIVEESIPVKKETKEEQESDDYRRLIEKAYNNSLKEGKNPSFFDIYDDRYKDELETINMYYHDKRGK